MLTRCGMLLHSFPMQRRLTWCHPPKAAAFFFPFSFFGFTMSELYESMPTNNGRWRLYQHPCMVRIMQSGEFRRWWSTRQILYMPIIPWKKTFFIQFAKHISVWKSNGVYDMKGKQLCRHVELSSLPCSPADPLRSQLAHHWSDQDTLHVDLVGFCRVAFGSWTANLFRVPQLRGSLGG